MNKLQERGQHFFPPYNCEKWNVCLQTYSIYDKSKRMRYSYGVIDIGWINSSRNRVFFQTTQIFGFIVYCDNYTTTNRGRSDNTELCLSRELKHDARALRSIPMCRRTARRWWFVCPELWRAALLSRGVALIYRRGVKYCRGDETTRKPPR